MLNNEIEANKFEKELLPIFEKVKFSSNKPFLIPAIDNKDEYDYLFYVLFHGAIYKTLLTIKNKTKFSYKEYMQLYSRCITVEVFDGEKTVLYLREPILKVSTYKDKETGLISESIFPLYQKTIDNDISVLNKIQKEEEKHNEFLKDAECFKNKDMDIDIDFDEF